MEMARLVDPGRVIRLRYEDLCCRPADELRRIAAAFGLSFEDVVKRIANNERFSVGHNVGGNEIRHDGAVRFNPDKEITRPALPRWLQRARASSRPRPSRRSRTIGTVWVGATFQLGRRFGRSENSNTRCSSTSGLLRMNRPHMGAIVARYHTIAQTLLAAVLVHSSSHWGRR